MLAISLAMSCRSAPPGAQANTAHAAPPWTAEGQSPEVRDSNDRFVAEVLKQIAGSEDDSAAKVFENVQIPWLKAIPARTFVGIMNGGYAAALGVTCSHCHVTTDFASDDKRPKRAAREMAVMHKEINTRLSVMKELATPAAENRSINCAVCHRGMVDPQRPTRH
jgi:hypothetical protein